MSAARLFIALVAALGFSLAAAPTVARPQPSLPNQSGTQLLPADYTVAFTLQGSEMQLGKFDIVDAAGGAAAAPFARALRISTITAPATEWNIQAAALTIAPVKAGDVVLAHFWIRCEQSMTGEAFTGFVFEESQAPYDKAAELRISAGAAWKECFVPFQAHRDFPAGQAHACFREGFDRQSVEIGGIELIDYGSAVRLEDLPRTRITYAGRSPDAPWRQAALARIEQIRKGDLTVQVTDAAGKPIPGAKVHAVLRRHLFGFGTAVDADLLTGSTSDAVRYQQTVATLFNRAVFGNDMKWPETYSGIPAQVDQAVQWLHEHDIDVRGHNLVWPGWQWLPTELKPMEGDPEKLREAAASHITSEVSHFRGKIIEWDVVNEPYQEHALLDILGPSVMADWFKLAHAADPAPLLMLNDFAIVDDGGTNKGAQDAFYNEIKTLKDAGAPIGAIGIESHFGSELTPPPRILEIFDRFSQLGLPIESTELSINLDDRQLQADFMRDYLIAAFSHPNVHGVIIWGFWEKRHWRPQSALFAADWSLRPIGKAWIDMVHKQWQTDTQLTADDAGQARVRGFCGQYDVTVDAAAKSKTVSVQLPHEGAKLTVSLD